MSIECKDQSNFEEVIAVSLGEKHTHTHTHTHTYHIMLKPIRSPLHSESENLEI